MEKVFLDTAPAADARQTRFEGFQNECVSFQAAVMSDDAPARLPVMLRAQSPLGSRVRVRSVRSVPVTLATLPGADGAPELAEAFFEEAVQSGWLPEQLHCANPRTEALLSETLRALPVAVDQRASLPQLLAAYCSLLTDEQT